MDEVDKAKELELEHRACSLNTVLTTPDHNPGETQLFINDTVCCVDCLDPIPPERMAIKPNAVRCVECKDQWERRHGRR